MTRAPLVRAPRGADLGSASREPRTGRPRTRRMTRRILPLLALLVAAAPLHGQTGATPRAADLDPSVVQVVTGGSWNGPRGGGTVRVVVLSRGWEHVHGEAHLQWLRQNPQTRRLEVASSVPVRELNRAGAWSPGTVRVVVRRTGATEVVLPAVNAYTGERRTLRLVVGEPGRYEIVGGLRRGAPTLP